jgi:phosphoenolpyruvate-protein phosphotransferase (PTS system enzyme I)
VETTEEKDGEVEKFDKAVLGAIEQVNSIREKKVLSHSREEIDILDTQIEFLNDPQIRSDVLDKIQVENKTASDAVIEVIFAAASMFGDMEDVYLKTRAADLQDIGNRILSFLNQKPQLLQSEFTNNTIIIAEDLSPSDTITLDVTKVAGFATISGGKTSHAAIIAKARGIPAVVACGLDLLKIENNDTIILDGTSGDIIIRPDENKIEEYKRKQKKIIEELSFLKALKDQSAITIDGHTVKLLANISDHTDLEQVFENGGEGVGLFRTELLFLGRDSFPSEEEQFQFYKQVALKSKGKPVIVRTIDIGGDKQLSYFGIPPENNPFLGYRAIRICLNQKDIFLTQLRAILRAGIFGNLKIMFPMISSIGEIRSAKECVQQAKEDLLISGINFRDDIETGIMIEVPSAALMADIFAKEVDFFSIGTNDLCQYTLAVDRMNDKVSGLYDHFNPGLLRLIKIVLDQANKHKINAGICGEMASDPLATLLLLGMGLEEFSMGAASIPYIKNIIIRNSLSKARDVCSNVMEMDNSDSIKRYLEEVSK